MNLVNHVRRWWQFQRRRRDIANDLKYLEAVEHYRRNGFTEPFDWDT